MLSTTFFMLFRKKTAEKFASSKKRRTFALAIGKELSQERHKRLQTTYKTWCHSSVGRASD